MVTKTKSTIGNRKTFSGIMTFEKNYFNKDEKKEILDILNRKQTKHALFNDLQCIIFDYSNYSEYSENKPSQYEIQIQIKLLVEAAKKTLLCIEKVPDKTWDDSRFQNRRLVLQSKNTTLHTPFDIKSLKTMLKIVSVSFKKELSTKNKKSASGRKPDVATNKLVRNTLDLFDEYCTNPTDRGHIRKRELFIDLILKKVGRLYSSNNLTKLVLNSRKTPPLT